MADADKPEVLRAAGDDSPHQQPVEQPGEPRREPHPPEPEKQPPQHSSSSNGVKMENDESVKEDKSELKEKSSGNKKANRFHPYSKDKNSGTGEKKGPNRNRVFISNIPYDMKWQAIKDLMREKVGEVTYVELFKDAEGKSRGCGVVEFKDEEFVKKALETMNKYDLSGRPLNIKEDDKSVPHEDYRSHDSKTPQLPRGLGGIGMGLGPGGQPISASQLNIGGVMGNLGPSGMGMDGPGFGGMNRIGGGIGFGGLEAMNSMGGFGGVGRMGELYRGAMTSSMERDFGRGDIGINRGFGDSFGRLGSAMIAGRIGASNMGPVGSGISGGMGGMNSVTGGMGMGLDRMSSSFDRMGPGIGAILERSIDMDRGFLSGPMGSGIRERIGSKGNQIFVRNLPFDLTWQKLKEKFSQCGHVMFAEIKMENGKSKGCGTVRFDSPESAEKACRIMNGIKISGREIDVRLDRNA
ncbi:myelin expression factor 2 isoform X5 [Lutra lutra]|uniref:Myelin expression factor 2 isoform X5 n=1 Tax=Mustela putorius furo TaxID=9669 RepID=A0A8U0UQC6_MUSPF|nr:myelin expression factor 2 isoform X5 [Mustela erminea]XP_032712460.1 myelin expression factor 2 isoform X5 [Lontra canadensis]XP_044085499.1 myelin expression factor 2 isoform X5 [Neogale vison]XP_044923593.1 myelin expression factor 2 isoform X5 [Mustela putorius furo]XP_047592811.1 myelin expression factor 2 isoform X5 [Lutra lutra]